MATITASNREAWQKQADALAPDRPSKGKRVTVTEGKHSGKSGLVIWHGINKFDTTARYLNEAQLHFRDMAGRIGYRVGIQIDGGEKIFVDADKVSVS